MPSNDLWQVIFGYKDTPSLNDLFTTDTRFKRFRYSSSKAVSKLMSLDAITIRALWKSVIHTDVADTTNRSPAMIAHLYRNTTLLSHRDVVRVHGLIELTMAFCAAHRGRARYITELLAPLMPVALTLDDADEHEIENLLMQGETFKLIIRTDSYEEEETDAVEFWVTPANYVALLPRGSLGGSVLSLEAHGAGAPAIPLSAPCLILEFAESGEGHADWKIKLEVAANGLDLSLTLVQEPFENGAGGVMSLMPAH